VRKPVVTPRVTLSCGRGTAQRGALCLEILRSKANEAVTSDPAAPLNLSD
jgi:hypothetical protein